ncbi:MAG: diacylglycerol kinase family protein [Anaerolineae bacterium]|nr:diacylglycerol kinase family protein [Anaerolineae bacterium]
MKQTHDASGLERIRETRRINPEDYSPIVSRSRWASFTYAAAGCAYMLRHQKNLRIQLAAAATVVVMGLWLGLGALEWALLVLVIGVNFLMEFINAALEAAVNLASSEIHPLARVSKDVAAGASLLAAVIAVIVGLLVMGPPLLARLGWR